MLSGSLWPVHFKPLQDELLSCWLVRLAHGHGMKVQTFCNQVFGNRKQVWNRDIDRLAPSWLVDEVSRRTGTPSEMTWNTTLRSYEGLLYRKFRMAGSEQWILSLKMYHRKRMGYGLQFCPACLAEDEIPYFRKCWRVAFNTICTRHKNMLLDRCPECGSAIAVHRLDVGKPDILDTRQTSYCYVCGLDLRTAPKVMPISYDNQTSALLLEASCILDPDYHLDNARWDLGRYDVMHQLCRIMTARKHVSLREFVLDQLGFPDIYLTEGYNSIELRSIEERQHLIQLAAWVLMDPESRIPAAWRAGSVRYNVLLKDFLMPPEWYTRIVGRLTDWRDRFD
ncbi:MAG: TniQ family protein [Methylobacter tundripaludum]|nr:TniQ family protein [Methylobacter tundripaludum]